MSSSEKYLPWDFIKKHQTIISEGKCGVYFFLCHDPYIEKIILNKIPRHFFEGEKLLYEVGGELTKDWFEKNIQNLDLFSNNESYLVLQADKMNKNVKEFLLSGSIDFRDRFFIFLFNKEDKFIDEFAKKALGTSFKIEQPRFWEGPKLFQFFCTHLKMQIPYDVQQYILENISHSSDEFINILKILSLEFINPSTMNLERVKKLLKETRLDQFKLASAFSDKKFEAFFKELTEKDFDFDSLRSLFAFMQGHLIKISDTSYIAKKSRPSKYDNQILIYANSWKQEELRSEMKFFGELEVLAKQKSVKLSHLLRTRLMSLYI